MKGNVDYRLYLVTDRDLMTAATLEQAVEQAILGGCTVVQLREKAASSRDFYEEACRLRALTRRYGVPLIINDRLDMALAVDADGLHVGQGDLPAAVCRRLLGPDKLLGVSVATVAEAEQARRDGADYLGIGAMFAQQTKPDARPVSWQTYQAIRAAVRLPAVVIGGMDATTGRAFVQDGIEGLAVVSAILAQPDIRAAAQAIRAVLDAAPDGR